MWWCDDVMMWWVFHPSLCFIQVPVSYPCFIWSYPCFIPWFLFQSNPCFIPVSPSCFIFVAWLFYLSQRISNTVQQYINPSTKQCFLSFNLLEHSSHLNPYFSSSSVYFQPPSPTTMPVEQKLSRAEKKDLQSKSEHFTGIPTDLALMIFVFSYKAAGYCSQYPSTWIF